MGLDKKNLRKLVKNEDVNSLAILIDNSKRPVKLEIFLFLPLKIGSSVILNITEYSREYIVRHLPKEKLVSLVRILRSDDSVDVLEHLPEHLLMSVLKSLSLNEQKKIIALLEYAKDTAGGIMEADVASMQQDMDVEDAINHIKDFKKKFMRVYNLFVVDSKGTLKGVISVSDLLIVDRSVKLKTIMNKKVKYVNPNVDKEKVAHIFLRNKIASLPVVNKKMIVIGRIIFDDAMKVIQDETYEDFLKMMGGESDINITDPVKKNVKKRLPWLAINLLTAIIAASTVSLFEKTIQAVVLLAVFMPIVAGMGGNAGSQGLAIAIRALALGKLNVQNMLGILFKEIKVGFIDGFVTGALMAVIAYLWKGNIIIGLIIFFAMLINMLVASIVGVVIPLALKGMKVDPAVGSGVMVTTFTDVIGFFSFLGIATLMIHMLV